MKYRIAFTFACAALVSLVMVAGGCQCEEEPIATIQRKIEFAPVNEKLLDSFYTSDETKFSLNFGRKTINRTWKESVRMTNKATDLEIEVSGITFKGDAGPFSLEEVPATIGKGASVEFRVVYKPTVDGSVDKATVVVETKDTNIKHAELNVFGEGTKSEALLEVVTPDDKRHTCDDDKGITVTVDFGEVPVGSKKMLTVRVGNTGVSTMNVTPTFAAPVDPAFAIASPTGETFTVEPDASKDMVVEFDPPASGVRFAKIELATNDINCKDPPNTISLTGRGVLPFIQVCGESETCPPENPSCICTEEGNYSITILFGDVNQGEQATKKIEIANIGDYKFKLSKVYLRDENPDFSLSPEVPPEVTLEKSGDAGGADKLVVNVTYAPTSASVGSDTVVIESNAGNAVEVEVNLNGASQPEIWVIPEGMIVFKTPIGQTETQQATVLNRGYANLQVESVAIDQTVGTPQSFGVKNLPTQWPTILGPGESFDFDVEFTNNPQISGDTAEIHIVSNDIYYNPSEPDHPYYILTLTSDDTSSDMPPTCKAVAPGGDVQKSKDTDLPKQIDLDGSQSSDTEDGTVAGYDWKLVFVPKDSAAVMQDSNLAAAYFMADKFGQYKIQLTVYDSLGQPSVPCVIAVSLIKDL
ncbi:MAG: choice-of-anchor D domain-containing protein [Deltaproteobacteria bacterium]|nr:choice-of-anchor D domain-containing protein [Deltaproteobacteria bacterium]